MEADKGHLDFTIDVSEFHDWGVAISILFDAISILGVSEFLNFQPDMVSHRDTSPSTYTFLHNPIFLNIDSVKDIHTHSGLEVQNETLAVRKNS